MEFVREETATDLRNLLGQGGGSFLSYIKLKVLAGGDVPSLIATNASIRAELAADRLVSLSPAPVSHPFDVVGEEDGVEDELLLAPALSSLKASSPGRIFVDNFVDEDDDAAGYEPSWVAPADEEDEVVEEDVKDDDDAADSIDLDEDVTEEEEEQTAAQALARMLRPNQLSPHAEDFGSDVVAFTDEIIECQ